MIANEIVNRASFNIATENYYRHRNKCLPWPSRPLNQLFGTGVRPLFDSGNFLKPDKSSENVRRTFYCRRTKKKNRKMTRTAKVKHFYFVAMADAYVQKYILGCLHMLSFVA